MACGGSGGHIFPAIGVAEEIRSRHPDVRIFFACGKKEIEETIFRGIPEENIVEIESAAFEGGRALWRPLFLIKLFRGFMDSRAFLKKEKPGLVAGFGGYFSFPVVLAAKSLGIRSIVHEQNVIPGVANKTLARWTDGVAISFSETQKYLPRCRVVACTGNPVRSLIEKKCREEAMKYFGFSPQKITALVLGGSQGAESINQFFLESLSLLPGRVKDRMQVLHLCGRMLPEEAERLCRSHGVYGKAYSFFDRMDLVYNAADFALGRAGATFLAEMESKKIPAILIPYPFAGAHQKENARVFQQSNPATILEQENVTAQKLAALIEECVAQAKRQPENGSGVSIPSTPGARVRLADFMLSFLS